VAGVFTKSIHFPQTNGVVKSAGGQDGFVLRYIYDADVNGYMTIGGSGNDAINQIVRDPTTNQLSIVGTMEAKASFGPSATPDKNGKFQPVYLNSHGGKDAFYARYTAGFKNLFAQRYGGNGDDYGQALAIGSSGAYIAGTFSKPMNGLTSIGGSDVFVKQINGGIYDIGSVANDAVGKLAIDSTGRLIVTGTYGASMTFNNIPLLDQGKSDVFVATFDRTFAPETIVGLGGQYTDTTTGLATGPDGAVCVVGSFQRWFDLGPGDISALIYGNVNGEFYLDRLIIE
jgi:hypothetical protein